MEVATTTTPTTKPKTNTPLSSTICNITNCTTTTVTTTPPKKSPTPQPPFPPYNYHNLYPQITTTIFFFSTVPQPSTQHKNMKWKRGPNANRTIVVARSTTLLRTKQQRCTHVITASFIINGVVTMCMHCCYSVRFSAALCRCFVRALDNNVEPISCSLSLSITRRRCEMMQHSRLL